MVAGVPQTFRIPYEPLFPLAVISLVGFISVVSIKFVQKWENDGKPKRFMMDTWDYKMMERDSRLSGNVNKQSYSSIAPPEFSSNSAIPLSDFMN